MTLDELEAHLRGVQQGRQGTPPPPLLGAPQQQPGKALPAPPGFPSPQQHMPIQAFPAQPEPQPLLAQLPRPPFANGNAPHDGAGVLPPPPPGSYPEAAHSYHQLSGAGPAGMGPGMQQPLLGAPVLGTCDWPLLGSRLFALSLGCIRGVSNICGR